MALSLTYKGFNYVDFYNGIYDTANLDTTMPEVAATGASSVALTPDFGIDVATDTVYAGNSITDTVADLTAAVQEATAEGMTSLVRPLIDILYPQVSPNNGAPNYYVPDNFTSIFDPNGTGATTIAYNPASNTTYAGDTPSGVTPSSIPKGTSDGDFVNYRGELETTDESGGDLDAATFFGSPTTAGSYDFMIVAEAKAAAAAGAKLFSVGTELDGLANDPNDTSYWDTLIADVRTAAPSLKLTYSANWASASQVTFWSKLDYVGLDGYVPLSNTIPNAANSDNPSLASLIAGWNTASSVQIAYSGGETVSQDLGGLSAIDAFDTLAQQSIDKQFIFTELGYQNDTGAANDPTGGSATGVPDPSLQAELFTAFFDAWGQAQTTAAANGGKVDGIPFSLVGAYFWDYVPDGSNDGWSPELNSQAAAVINSNFSTADPVVVVPETNVAGVGGYEGEPTDARGTAGTGGTGALAGDSDTNGAALSITAITGGTVGSFFSTKYGSLQLNANGSYTYFPANSTALQDAPTGAPAADVINFTVTDANGATATSALTISVYRDPVVVAESASTGPGGTINRAAGPSGTGALAGDSDPDGVSLSVAAINELGEPISSPIAGSYGTLTLNANGSYSYVADSAAALATAFSADNGAPLTDGFTLLVSGGLGTYSITNLAVTIDDSSVVSAPSDFNGDEKSDILWQYEDAANSGDPQNGNAAIWLMNGTSATATPVVATPPPDWHAIATGDFNGDGKADILWQYEDPANPGDPQNGNAAIWLMNGTSPTATPIVATAPPDWRVIGTGDFNGDGKSDILWQYEDTANPSDPQNGNAAIWLMNGTTPTATTVIATPPPDWHAIATGDFNGDGKSDILWQYEDTANPSDPLNGEAAIWLMNGTTPTATTVVAAPPPDWRVIGTGDFNGDGKSDILWQYEDPSNPSDPLNGDAAIWLMNGTTATATTVFATPPAAWDALGTGDFNGDGKSDVIWQYENTANPNDPQNGAAAIWLMNGTTPTATPVIATPPPSWHVIPA